MNHERGGRRHPSASPTHMGRIMAMDIKEKNNMPKKKKTKKTKVYICAHYEFDYDDLGKFCWCKNPLMFKRECDAPRYYYCQKFCPGFKKGHLAGTWEISDGEKEIAEEFKKGLDKETKGREKKERALLKYLKEKYES